MVLQRSAVARDTGLDVQLDESALIRAAQQGDQDAFEQLVRVYDQSVLRLAMNLLRSPEDARDAYQEAFLRVHRNLHNFRFDCSFHTWLYRIVTNLCLDQIRKRKVRREEATVMATADGPLDRLDAVAEQRAGRHHEVDTADRDGPPETFRQGAHDERGVLVHHLAVCPVTTSRTHHRYVRP